MHVTAALAIGVGITKYSIPVSELGCLLTHRLMVALLVLFDVRSSYSLHTILLEMVTLAVYIGTNDVTAKMGSTCRFEYKLMFHIVDRSNCRVSAC